MNRDELRTPMQWSDAPNAGFSLSQKTWLPVNTDFKEVNVDKESRNDNSLLQLIRHALQLRNETPALHAGSLELMSASALPKGVLGYKRKLHNKEVLVILNFSATTKEILLDGSWKLLSINNTDSFTNGKMSLGAYGGIILSK